MNCDMKEQKAVCHLTSVHPANDTRILYKECMTLSQAGYQVTLVAKYAPVDAGSSIQIQFLNTAGSRLWRMTRTAAEAYKSAKAQDADIYHFHDPELIPVGLLLKWQGKKVIYDVHEDLPRQIMTKDWIPKPLRKLVSRISERIEHCAARKFDAVVGATPHICERFRPLNKRTINVNNYPLLRELHTPETGWTHKERAVCYVGGINRIRGIFEIIEAMKLVDARFLLAGTFSDAAEYEKAHRHPGWQKVNELGQVDRKGVKCVLSRSLAGLVVFHPAPNHINAKPNKMFEYMSAGLPVIASDFPLWREIVEGSRCGICVDPLDPDDIAGAINWIIDHPDEAKKMGDNGRKAVEKKYNWELEEEKLLSLYGELLG